MVIAGFFVGVAGCGGVSVQSDGDGSGQTGVGGTNAGGTNAGGTNAGGTNVGGTNAGGTNVGGTNVGGTNVGGTNVGGANAGGPGLGGAGAGGASPSCARSLPDVATVGCDWRAALGAPGQSGYCYKGGCHKASIQAGALDLTPDDFLAARLLDVPAKHEIVCTGATACDAAVPTCEKCAKCVLGEVLISTAEPGAGAMFDRMAPFIPGTTTSTFSLGCGDAMPTYNTTGTSSYTQADKDCLVRFFTALASTPGTWPCQSQ
jgi:hypothetical protein